MTKVWKRFPTGRAKPHYARVFWKPTFMSYLFRKFIYHTFSMKEVEEYFMPYLSPNATRLRILKLYRTGWLMRKLEGKSEIRPNKKIYIYTFTPSAIRYRSYNGPFDYEKGPLMKHILCNANR